MSEWVLRRVGFSLIAHRNVWRFRDYLNYIKKLYFSFALSVFFSAADDYVLLKSSTLTAHYLNSFGCEFPIRSLHCRSENPCMKNFPHRNKPSNNELDCYHETIDEEKRFIWKTSQGYKTVYIIIRRVKNYSSLQTIANYSFLTSLATHKLTKYIAWLCHSRTCQKGNHGCFLINVMVKIRLWQQ